MEFEEILDEKMTFSYTLTCPFCSAKYPVMKTITFVEDGAEHLILWENEDEGMNFQKN